MSNQTDPKPAGTGDSLSAKQNPQTAPLMNRVLKRLHQTNTLVIFGAIVAALLIGALIVIIFDEDVQRTAGYLFARPSDFFAEVGSTFQAFFSSLVRGALFDYKASSTVGMFKPLTETLTRSVPLILAGLAISVAFRAGLFNIGVQGQFIMGMIFGLFAGAFLHLPLILHMIVAIICAIIGGMIWGGIPGLLKAKVGANEVIVTIMMNSCAALFLAYLLNRSWIYGDGGTPGKSVYVDDTATYPLLLGGGFRLNLSFIIAILAAVFVWWLLERSTFGFELRAAGANPHAARTAGISVTRVIFLTMVISGALAGLAGTAPILGTERFLTSGAAGSYGFDAITVALLGKSTPLGTVLAGLLFGALAAGASTMQASAGIPVDIVQITQAVIVLLIAASEAVRYFRERRRIAERTSASVARKSAAESKGEAK